VLELENKNLVPSLKMTNMQRESARLKAGELNSLHPLPRQERRLPRLNYRFYRSIKTLRPR